MKASGLSAERARRAMSVRARRLAGAARSQTISAVQRMPPSGLTLPRGRVPLFWFNGQSNFGDVLAPRLLDAGLDLRGVWVPPSFRGKVLFVGSVINCLAPGDVVIGSGAITDRRHDLPETATIVGLRGPRTASRLGLRKRVPYGDPGMVAASLFGISRADSNGRIALIPHFADAAEVRRLYRESASLRDECDILDVAADPEALIRQVSHYDACISSSLHGVIVAESLGVPTVPVSFGDRVVGGDFKFGDYFEGTGRSFEGLSKLDDAFEALERGRVDDPHLDLSPVFSMFEHAADVFGQSSSRRIG